MNRIENTHTERKESELSVMSFGDGISIHIYPGSANEVKGVKIFIGRQNEEKSLFVVAPPTEQNVAAMFEGEILSEEPHTDWKMKVKMCPLNHHNARSLQQIFPFTRAVPIGLHNSYGFGDRLGLANPGHLRALKGFNFRPILAQQSIRELTRTQRTPEDVMDAAVWAVYQEGYKDGFGADADHLKTVADVDRLVKAGFTMFTIDPSDHIVNGVTELSAEDLRKRVEALPWNEFGDSHRSVMDKYKDMAIRIDALYSITSSEREIDEACLKYMAAILNIKKIHLHLKTRHANYNCEIEVSIDETDTITTPFEHFFIVTELKRLGVTFVGLAPRFVGDFEKGIEYKGDIQTFKEHYLKHAAIAKHFGTYKISFHSGSDKFKVYDAVASLPQTLIHVKTAGTSYLEALKVVAIRAPELFKGILDFSVSLYDTEKKSYHVTGDVKKIKAGKDYKESELEGLFASTDIRQALHVTYGRVLTERNEKSEYIFRNRIYECLEKNEALHYEILVKHFHRHLEPFENWT